MIKSHVLRKTKNLKARKQSLRIIHMSLLTESERIRAGMRKIKANQFPRRQQVTIMERVNIR